MGKRKAARCAAQAGLGQECDAQASGLLAEGHVQHVQHVLPEDAASALLCSGNGAQADAILAAQGRPHAHRPHPGASGAGTLSSHGTSPQRNCYDACSRIGAGSPAAPALACSRPPP